MIKISKHNQDIDFYLHVNTTLFKYIRFWITDEGCTTNHYTDFTYGVLL